MITYHRDSFSTESTYATYDHVRQTISAMASDTDDPHEFEREVEMNSSVNEDGSIRFTGTLDREPTAYELPEDYQEPVENKAQRGFGERILEGDELEQHLRQKGLQ